MIFEIQMPVLIKFTVFWNVTPCSLVKRYHITKEPAAFFFRTVESNSAFSGGKKNVILILLVGNPVLCFDFDL